MNFVVGPLSLLASVLAPTPVEQVSPESAAEDPPAESSSVEDPSSEASPVEPSSPDVAPGEPAVETVAEPEEAKDDAVPAASSVETVEAAEADESEAPVESEAGGTPPVPAEAVAVSPAEEARVEPEGPTFTPGVQMFLRVEGRINPDFDLSDNTPPDQVRVLERARLQLRGTWGPVSAFVQAQDARAWGFEGSTVSNEGNLDLHQGWIDVGGASSSGTRSGSIRAGRQEIAWGSQRMIGSLLWAPAARSFDAVRLRGKAGPVAADLFVSMLAPPSTFEVEDPLRPSEPPMTVQSRGNQLAAGMLSYAALPAFNVEVMTMADFADASPAAPARERRILDFGGRVWGTPVEGLSYEAEGHGQVGREGATDHRAWAWTANAKYVHDGERVDPGVKVGYSMASGSTCTADPSTGGCGAAVDRDFFNFYPTNHIHYGLVDLLGWRNVRDLEVTGTLGVAWMQAALGYHYFQLHESAGRWRNAGGGLVGAGWDPSNTEHGLGHELDFVVTMKPWKVLMIQPGYGVFIPTGAGKTLGGSSPQQFLYLWLVATF